MKNKHPRTNRSLEDAMSTAFHSVFTHLEGKTNHIKMLFVGFSSGFSTTFPMKMIGKLHSLCLITTLTNRPQTVWIDSRISSTMVLNTSAPVGGVFNPSCSQCATMNPRHGENSIEKQVDVTTIISKVFHKNESSFLGEINSLQ